MMAKTHFIAKVFRQHNSLVMVVPGAVCIALNVSTGTYLVLEWDPEYGAFKMTKFKPEGFKDERARADSDQSNKGG